MDGAVVVCTAFAYASYCRACFGYVQGHAMRAAINTPIQGSAADVATAAMLSIAACPELRALGWSMLLQVLVSPCGCCLLANMRQSACCVCNLL